MKAQLGRATDDLQGLLGVGHSRKLDDDAAIARALQGGFAHPEGVHASAQHLERSRRRIVIDPLAFGVLGLQDDLSAPPQVQPQTYGP